MRPINPYLLLLISFLGFQLLGGCSEDEKITAPTEEEEAEPHQFLEINQFIDENMSAYYFWNDEMPDLSPEDIEAPKEYFDSLMYKEDRWSFITDDYQELFKYFSGVQKSPGYSLMPIYLKEGSNQVIAFVEFVHKNTPAEEKGLKRGDMIYKIDGTLLDDQNYTQLLNKDAFTITLGTFNETGQIVEASSPISLTSEETDLNPIIAASVTDTASRRIGYLAYSSFISDYDAALADTIEHFQNQGITDFVLDLRYNTGGAISTARKLAEMLVPEGNEGKTFIREVFNDLQMQLIAESQNMTADSLKLDFRAIGEIKDVHTKLDIENFYVLTTSTTASASEMIIYGLEPYMNVIQIGEQTHGKYYGSATFSDEEEHSWAIQPIIMRMSNATDNINYSEGLPPDHKLQDDFYLFESHPLGAPEELFMSKAISLITGRPFPYEDDLKKSTLTPIGGEKSFKLRKKINPFGYRMWTSSPGTASIP